MRRGLLLKSIQRRLAPGEDLIDAAFMWHRHRLMLPYAAAAFVAMLVVAELAGFERWDSRLGIASAGATIATMATTTYRVLAQTTQGFVILRASRLRQYALEILKRLPAPIDMTVISSYLVLTDWMVDDVRYSVPKSSEQSMARMATSG